MGGAPELIETMRRSLGMGALQERQPCSTPSRAHYPPEKCRDEVCATRVRSSMTNASVNGLGFFLHRACLEPRIDRLTFGREHGEYTFVHPAQRFARNETT
jgi:hypothetical protein